MKITFPYWGNYTIALKTLFEKLGLDVIAPEKTNPRAVREGARISPEMYCLPLKINIGNYLSAIKKGADTIFIVTSLGGSCRLRYYGVVEEKVLSEAGHDIKFINFDQTPKDIYFKIKEVSGTSFLQIMTAAWFFFKKLRLIEDLERKANYLRPREKTKGKTDEILRQAFLNLEEINTKKGLAEFKKEIDRKISELNIDKRKDVPKIGLIGEIYTVTDGAVNFEVEEKLGKEGIEVHREMDITYHLKKRVFPWKDWLIQRKINPYLKSTVGGHGRDAIYEMLHYAKNDFDGVVHLLPFGCMPETTVRPILQKIHLESGIPFLSLSLDEQVAEAGINTRIEAFVDVVKNYHNKKI
jgi:predicted nucleotide-binding protein (sugar kinase/HSP70/actin superfamily)